MSETAPKYTDETPEKDEQDEPESTPEEIQEPRLWHKNGWTARVIKNEEDEGWAVEMIRDGDEEPVLVTPWTMGRDKKNPKPLDLYSFNTLVKTANDVLRRHQQQRERMLHKSVTLHSSQGERIRVNFDIIPEEDDPHAILSAWDDNGVELAKIRVPPNFKFTTASATRWVEAGFREP